MADQPTPDQTATDTSEVDKQKKPAAPRYFSLGPYPLGWKSLTGLFAIFLGGLEWIRLKTLDVPTHIAMSGFDTAAAMVANIGFGVVALALIILAIILFAGAIFVLIAMTYLLSRIGVFVVNYTFRSALAVQYLSPAARLMQRVETVGKQSRLQRWAEKTLPQYKSKRTELQERYAAAKRRVIRHYRVIILRLGRFGGKGWRLLVPEKGAVNEERDGSIRFAALFVIVLSAVGVSATGYFLHWQEIQKASEAYAQSLQPMSTEPRQFHAPVGTVPELQYPYWKRYSLRSFIRHATTQKARVGTLLVSKSENAASHLAPNKDSKADTFRTEKLFYLGDFGEWALVAPVTDYSARVLIRRSAILEFSFDGRGSPVRIKEPQNPAAPAVTTKVDMGDLYLSLAGHPLSEEVTKKLIVQIQPTLWERLEGKLAERDESLKEALEGLQEDVAGRSDLFQTRWLQSSGFDKAFGEGLSSLGVRLEELSGKAAELTDLQAGLAGLIGDLGALTGETGPIAALQADMTDLNHRLDREAASRTQLRADVAVALKSLAGELATTRTEFARAMEPLTDLPGKINGQSTEIEAFRVALKKADDNLRNAIAALDAEDRELHQSFESHLGSARRFEGRVNTKLAQLGEGLAPVSVIVTEVVQLKSDLRHIQQKVETAINNGTAGLDRLTNDLEKLDGELRQHAKHRGGTVPGFPDEIIEMIKDGVTTRPASLMSSLSRQGLLGGVKSCKAGAEEEDVHHVDFAEGRVVGGNSEQISALVVAVMERTEGALVILEGGASYTGQPELNLARSESRAEWVKKELLRKIMKRPGGDPTELDQLVRRNDGLYILAYGVGERVANGSAGSARAVRAYICSVPEELASL